MNLPTKNFRGRKANPTLRNSNVFKQLMHAKNDLALSLVEQCQDRWESIVGVLMGKALDGDMRAMALLLDYVVEKAPQKFQISTSPVDVGSMSMEDMMRMVMTYDSMMQEKERTILGEVEEIESHPLISAPPPQENTRSPESGNRDFKSTEAPASKPSAQQENAPEGIVLHQIDATLLCK